MLCAQPVIAPDWTLTYPSFLAENDLFNLTLNIAPNVPLPTKPIFKIFGLHGGQRIDHDIEIDETEMIPFFVNDGISAPLDCSLTSMPIGCLTELKMDAVGIEGNSNSGRINILDNKTSLINLISLLTRSNWSN